MAWSAAQRAAVPHTAGFFGLASGLLFATHPVHVDAVACAVGRAELLAALLFLAVCVQNVEPPTKGNAVRRAALAAGLTLVATCCKEQGVCTATLPIAVCGTSDCRSSASRISLISLLSSLTRNAFAA